MARVALTPIPEPDPDTRSVLHRTGEGTVFFSGGGDTDFSCGRCGALLARKVDAGQLRSLVLKCAGCGTFNDTGDIAMN